MVGQSDNHYKTLGVGHGASADEIKRAYRRRIKKWHPDINHSLAAEGRARGVNRAYEVLSDSASRAEYDEAMGWDTTEYPLPAKPAPDPSHPRHGAPRANAETARRVETARLPGKVVEGMSFLGGTFFALIFAIWILLRIAGIVSALDK